ncbi:MAG: uroporphyrinogen decarboxylase family protein [Phycisphaerae bacterium]|jgi:uroporphyrinogen decarboxylase|nr:uroporphyrinogen decarboxylase family protein [Phycisphaerae bacterium]
MCVERWWKGPVKAEPDFDNMLKVLRRERPARPTLFEFFMNEPLYRILAPEALSGPNSSRIDNSLYELRGLMMHAFANAGYDYSVLYGSDFKFPAGEIQLKATRSWNEGAVITDRKSFEKYNWPDPDDFDYGILDALADEMPGGMKLIAYGPGGVLENILQLVGFENLCMMLVDDPDLASEIFDAIGARLVRHYEICVQHDTVGAVIGNDDWGFKTQTMLSPADMRRYVIPWHKKIVQVAHAAGKPAILHSCGNLAAVMDDVIDIGYDAKHSYEDTIQPVEDAYEQYHDRIAILGGIDLDFVVRSEPQQVYKRAKTLLQQTADRGGYALGTGNSVPEYAPHENYLAMIAAATENR